MFNLSATMPLWGEVTNTKDYTRLFEVDSSHMTVSSQVKSFEFAQVDLGSF